MERVKVWLRDYGLNDTEIEVYLCIVKYPGQKVADIQRQTGLVRTTIYYSMAQLKTAGLISESVQNNIRTYRAASTDNLRQNIEAKITSENSKLEQLSALEQLFDRMKSSKTSTDSYVARFEGVRPIKQAIEEALRCKSKKWHIIAARDNFLYHTSKPYQRYYLKERQRRGITAKTLWEPVESGSKLTAEDIFYRHPRKLPKEFLGTFKSLVILYDDTTLIVDPYEQKTAHAIHNAASTQLLRLLHNFAWQNSNRVK